MDIEGCFDTMKDIQHKFLLFLEKTENEEENYQNLVTLFNNHKIREDQCKLKSLFILISKISTNHFPSSDFFSKIEKIILFFRDDIKKIFSNFEIFFIFKENKRILLFLIKNNLLAIDQPIAVIMQKNDYESKKYPHFFFPEIKNFLKEEKIEEISKEIPENFEELRSNGENESEVCRIIRNDSIEEFITFSEKTNLSLNSKVDQSIFETNSFLLSNYQLPFKLEKLPKNFYNSMFQYMNDAVNNQEIKQQNDQSSSISSKISLIEYAAFYGSLKIIKYLVKNNVKLNPFIWIYAIHSNNMELIQFIEDNKVKSTDWQNCFEESIKCFHNTATVFIQSNYLLYLTISPKDIFKKSLAFHNYDYVRPDFIDSSSLFKMCKYDHPDIFKILLETIKIDVNTKIVYIYFILIKFLYKLINIVYNS